MYSDLAKRFSALVIFKNLRSDTALKALVNAALAAENGETERAVEEYALMVSRLYRSGDDLSRFVLKLTLRDDNIYIRRTGNGEAVGDILDGCLETELETLSRLASIPCDFFREKLGCDFLPRYRTSDIDLKKEYRGRLAAVNKFGYGIFADHHVFIVRDGNILPVENPDPITLGELCGYETQRGEVIANTKALLAGKPANNVLLYGDCGTGKSSTVKAVANEFCKDGLRLIELKKKQLHEIPTIVEIVSANPLKFIIFVDDLSFTEDDDDFAALKAILEGSVSSTASNLCIYATSNRRHLVRETFSAREGDDIHRNDTMQELLSLSDRFGLRVTFSKPDKQLYLAVAHELAAQYGLDMPSDELEKRAEAFAISRGGRSPRTAKQLVEYLKGME